MTFSNTQLTKIMLSQLLRIRKNNKIISFLNMQLIKKHVIIITFMTS